MKFTFSWLKEHLETNASLAEITDALTDLGLEVEEVINPADRLKAFTIGKVISAEQHPDADRLRVCQVATDAGDTQIICGAPNARAGITVVVAKPGTYVPGIDTTIQIGKIRGIESHGMMCSEREMELSEEHDGIIELPSGEVGDRFTNWLEAHQPDKIDPMIEIAITPNRPDALGVAGIARDIAARGLGVLKTPDHRAVPGTFPCPIKVTIDEDARAACPVFYGRVIRSVKNSPSPKWLEQRLLSIGLRPISFLVDVTNFMTYDRNRPLHVFDADKVIGGLRVHLATGGEEFLALDDKTYRLDQGMTAISDENGVESLAGIMGGLASGVTDETTNVFLEAAYFDPVRTALTGRALKIHSDARYRFERGIDAAWTPHGIEVATQIILDHAGGEASQVVVAGALPDHSRAYRLNPDRVQSLVGMDIPAADQRKSLTDLGFVLEDDMAHVPSWRPDVQGEADLIEEVARIASLTKLQGRPLSRALPGVPKPILSLAQKRERVARRHVAAAGYHECVSYSFIDQSAAELFGGGTGATRVDNPISSDMSHMRPDLLPGLLRAAARNQARGFANFALFEVGAVFAGGEPEDQSLQVAGILVGAAASKSVHGAERIVDLFDAKADAEEVLLALGAPNKMQILRDAAPWWHPGRHGRFCLGPKKTLGVFGELHPKILRNLDIKGRVVGFTLYPNEIPAPRVKSATRTALHLNELQAVERDFAFVVDKTIEAQTLVNAASGADKAMIEHVRVFDEFIGGALGDNKKSLAITVRLQPKDATLKDKDIAVISSKIIEKVQKATGGILRG